MDDKLQECWASTETLTLETRDNYTLAHGDCLEVMGFLKDSSVDTCISDPPYGLSSGKTKYLGEDSGSGFMGKRWDHGVPGVPYWKEVLRVLKPGGTILAFGGTRTFHRLACAIEDAGFELRDSILVWSYGSGFPKSLDISKAIDKEAGVEREVVGTRGLKSWKTEEKSGSLGGGTTRQDFDKVNALTAPATNEAQLWEGWGTSLKPSYEPVLVAMKPLDGTYAHNALTHGVAGLNIDGARIGGEEVTINTFDDGAKPFGNGAGHDYTSRKSKGRWPANTILVHHPECECVGTKKVKTGTAYEPDPKEMNRSIYGGTNTLGRTCGYANEDGTETVEKWECHPECSVFRLRAQVGEDVDRFFYCSKVSKKERTHAGRLTNAHPTLKPVDLLRYFCKLTATPTGGIILDPFMGSGSTGIAARLENRHFIGIELEEESFETATKRIEDAELYREDFTKPQKTEKDIQEELEASEFPTLFGPQD